MTQPLPDDDLFANLFHDCAFAAYLDQAAEQGGPPDAELTRRRAYAYYEAELARRNGWKTRRGS